MGKRLLLIWLLCFGYSTFYAQCEYVVNGVDSFDSTYNVIMPSISTGLLIPSNFETVDGIKIVEESKVVFAFSEDDKSEVISLFMIIGALEREYLSIDPGENVLLAFADSTVVGLMNYPNKGNFDKSTNMRIYQHTTVLPFDIYYKFLRSDLVGIRIRYKNKKRDIVISPEQSEKIKKYLMCLGEAIGLYPLAP